MGLCNEKLSIERHSKNKQARFEAGSKPKPTAPKVSSQDAVFSREPSFDAAFETSSMEIPMKLISSKIFKSIGRIPRCSEEIPSISLSEIPNRNRSLVVYISHRWVSPMPEPKTSRPDSKEGIKYKLIVKALEYLSELIGEENEIYIWIDFFSIHQDDLILKRQGIRSLPAYISNCDCMFTPFYENEIERDTDTDNTGPPEFLTSAHKSFKCFGNTNTEYFGRSWCRLEMFLGKYVPVPVDGFDVGLSNSETLASIVQENPRPHFYTHSEFNEGEVLCFPRLSDECLQSLDPLDGHLTVEQDREHIIKILRKNNLHIPQGPGYIGGRVKGMREGYGEEHYEDGSRYEGHWSNDKRDGSGMLYYKTGARYEGSWLNDLKDGQGICYFVDGSKYEGQWKEDRKHGQGTYHSADGDWYEGRWEKDARHGYGTYFYAEEDGWYEGQWENGKKHGWGTFHYASGDTYEGRWEHGKKHGHGTYHFAVGESYEGKWLNDERHDTCLYSRCPIS